MYVTPFGAAGEVTGSCYLVEANSTRLLIDCGLFQGNRKLERLNFIPRQIAQNNLNAVLLTHAHLDHCGRLPLLVKSGFRGPIYSTPATAELTKLILTDAAKIQEDDAARENRRRQRAGEKPVQPLFTHADVQLVLGQLRHIDYNHWFDLAEGIKAQAQEAGHILGSASIELVVGQNGGRRHLVFSGDLGPFDVPIMRDPSRIEYCDTVFMESTYGDRDHKSMEETRLELQNLLQEAISRKGKVLIPTFAVGRTQQLLYHLAELIRQGLLPSIPIYLDSPMAIEATNIYKHHLDLQDAESRRLQLSGQLEHDLSSLVPCITSDESQALNSVAGPCIIMAGAGMCTAGRILHHFRHNLWLPETTVIIVGYQARGSVGRHLLEGAEAVKIFGETIKVRARIAGLGGFSAHAGQTDLLRWLDPMSRRKPRIFLTHGESHPLHQLAAKIEERYGLCAHIPKLGERLAL